MNLTTRFVKETENPSHRWNKVISSASEAWIFHLYELHQFRIKYANSKGFEHEDLSFFVYEDKKLVGLVTVLLIAFDDGITKNAHFSYHDTPLPWPCFLPNISQEVRNFAFDELEALGRKKDVCSITLMLSEYDSSINFRENSIKDIYSRNYFDISYRNHLVKIVPDLLCRVGGSISRYIKNRASGYNIEILEGEQITDSLIEDYAILHAKDAGFVPRPIDTYYAQAVSGRIGNGFWVTAREKQSGKLTGILQVLHFKAFAYPDSIAIDPEFEKGGLSYLLHWNAIRECMLKGCCTYDLGIAAEGATFTSLYSKKYRGISLFKDGWSQGDRKNVYIFKKFLKRSYIQQFFDNVSQNIFTYTEDSEDSTK